MIMDKEDLRFFPSDEAIDILKGLIPYWSREWPLTEEDIYVYFEKDRKKLNKFFSEEETRDYIEAFKDYFEWKEFDFEEFKEWERQYISESFYSFLYIIADNYNKKSDFKHFLLADKKRFFPSCKYDLIHLFGLEDAFKYNRKLIDVFMKRILAELLKFAAVPRKYQCGILRIRRGVLLFEVDKDFVRKRAKLHFSEITEDMWQDSRK